MIPLQLKLKRKKHKKIAYAQDLIVEGLYDFFSNAVIHGGTAIWRCYKGNRFSEDIDVYIEKDKKKINGLFEALKRIGFKVNKKRIKENSLYSTLDFNGTIVRFEALFKKHKNPFLKEYETSEGNFINVFTLTPEDLIKEKIETYKKRKKIRDLYDVFFLLKYVKDEKKVSKKLDEFVASFESPVDEKNLEVIIISGAVPKIKDMITHIKRWAR